MIFNSGKIVLLSYLPLFPTTSFKKQVCFKAHSGLNSGEKKKKLQGYHHFERFGQKITTPDIVTVLAILLDPSTFSHSLF